MVYNTISSLGYMTLNSKVIKLKIGKDEEGSVIS
jgi:hypothetical protein